MFLWEPQNSPARVDIIAPIFTSEEIKTQEIEYLAEEPLTHLWWAGISRKSDTESLGLSAPQIPQNSPLG